MVLFEIFSGLLSTCLYSVCHLNFKILPGYKPFCLLYAFPFSFPDKPLFLKPPPFKKQNKPALLGTVYVMKAHLLLLALTHKYLYVV